MKLWYSGPIKLLLLGNLSSKFSVGGVVILKSLPPATASLTLTASMGCRSSFCVSKGNETRVCF